MMSLLTLYARKVGEVGMSENRPEKRKVEFIESYWTGGVLGSDYQWSDNHGELIRCKDCKHGSLYCTEDVCGETLIECNRPDLGDAIEIHRWNWFCADGEKKKDRLNRNENRKNHRVEGNTGD